LSGQSGENCPVRRGFHFRTRWLLDHTLLMGWRFRPLSARELLVCLAASLGVAVAVGGLIGAGALVATHAWPRLPAIESRAIEISVVFAMLYFLTGGLAGVYVVPLTLRLPGALGSAVRGALFFSAGVISMAAGLRVFTPITGIPVHHGLVPVMIAADGAIVCAIGLVIVRFHQLEAEMRDAYADLRRRERSEGELRELAARAETAALQAQINPHFLFNTLNSITALIELDPARATVAIETLADLFRYTVGAGQRPGVRLDEEWRFLLAYLGLEKMRFGDRLRLEQRLDAACGGIIVPGLLLQPIVENAVLYGIAPFAEGGTIRLQAAVQEDTCTIEVEDRHAGEVARAGQTDAAAAGREKNAERGREGGGIALQNIRRRLELAFPGAHLLEMQRHDAGTRVVLKIALQAGNTTPASESKPLEAVDLLGRQATRRSPASS
jgi:hypothetical protein